MNAGQTAARRWFASLRALAARSEGRGPPIASRRELKGYKSLETLLTAIVTWLSINYGLAADYDHPAVELLPADKVAAIRYGPQQASAVPEVLAVYLDAENTIVLTESWAGRTPADLSILVHEMVHHLQNRSRLTYACPAAREKLAYAAQDAWLGLFGQNLRAAFDLDPMSLKLATHCMKP